MHKLWLKLVLFAWRKASGPQGKGIGLPLQRDPDAPCEYYAPRKVQHGDFQDCDGDGHYLCARCCHFKKGGVQG